MSSTSPSSSRHSDDNGRSYVFYSYVDNRSGNRYHTNQFSTYNHGGINTSHTIFPQEDITRGVTGDNIHRKHPYYYYPSMPTHPNKSMPPHHHHNIPPHIYPRIPPHQVFLCQYCTSNPTYALYEVLHYPHISPLGYLHTSSSRLPCSVFPPHSSKNMSEYRRNIINRRFNE